MVQMPFVNPWIFQFLIAGSPKQFLASQFTLHLQVSCQLILPLLNFYIHYLLSNMFVYLSKFLMLLLLCCSSSCQLLDLAESWAVAPGSANEAAAGHFSRQGWRLRKDRDPAPRGGLWPGGAGSGAREASSGETRWLRWDQALPEHAGQWLCHPPSRSGCDPGLGSPGAVYRT